MKLSKESTDLLTLLSRNGGSLERKGNGRSGRALVNRKFATATKDELKITAAGRKWLEKN